MTTCGMWSLPHRFGSKIQHQAIFTLNIKWCVASKCCQNKNYNNNLRRSSHDCKDIKGFWQNDRWYMFVLFFVRSSKIISDFKNKCIQINTLQCSITQYMIVNINFIAKYLLFYSNISQILRQNLIKLLNHCLMYSVV